MDVTGPLPLSHTPLPLLFLLLTARRRLSPTGLYPPTQVEKLATLVKDRDTALEQLKAREKDLVRVERNTALLHAAAAAPGAPENMAQLVERVDSMVRACACGGFVRVWLCGCMGVGHVFVYVCVGGGGCAGVSPFRMSCVAVMRWGWGGVGGGWVGAGVG
jgi:hypothetical protein